MKFGHDDKFYSGVLISNTIKRLEEKGKELWDELFGDLDINEEGDVNMEERKFRVIEGWSSLELENIVTMDDLYNYQKDWAPRAENEFYNWFTVNKFNRSFMPQIEEVFEDTHKEYTTLQMLDELFECEVGTMFKMESNNNYIGGDLTCCRSSYLDETEGRRRNYNDVALIFSEGEIDYPEPLSINSVTLGHVWTKCEPKPSKPKNEFVKFDDWEDGVWYHKEGSLFHYTKIDGVVYYRLLGYLGHGGSDSQVSILSYNDAMTGDWIKVEEE